nr:hypothetical protein Q903MT_gene1976 [Picea sitchensis]
MGNSRVRGSSEFIRHLHLPISKVNEALSQRHLTHQMDERLRSSPLLVESLNVPFITEIAIFIGQVQTPYHFVTPTFVP